MSKRWIWPICLTFVALILGWGVLRQFSDHPPLRLFVVGVDSADWDIIDPLIESGQLPHFAALRAQGVRGRLRTLEDIPLSPVIWTSVVTGKSPAKHGITWFLVDTPAGQRVPVRSTNRQGKAIWNIAADYELPVAVVGWWATTPAEPIPGGVIAADALGYHGFGRAAEGAAAAEKVWPVELAAELEGLMPSLQQVDFAIAEPFFEISADEYYERAFHPARSERPAAGNPMHLFQEAVSTTLGYTAICQRLLEERDFRLFLSYYESVDSLSHLFMKYAPPQQAWVSDEDYAKYHNVVTASYQFIDARLGELMQELGDDFAIVLISDHGFRSGDDRPKSEQTVDLRGAHLDHDVEGVFLAAGGPFRNNGEIAGASVLDITPTLLYALGLPVARDMDGRVLTEVFLEEFRQQHSVHYVETFDDEPAVAPATVRDDTEFELDAAMERLRSLGYVSDDTSATNADAVDSSPEQHNNLGHILLGKGDFAGARREFEAVLDAHPGHPDALTNLGLVAMAEGRFDRALTAFHQALQSDPNHVPALLQMADLRIRQGNLAAAEAMVQQAIAIDGRLPGVYLKLGDLVQRQQRYAEAKKIFEHALELDPLSVGARYNLGVVSMQMGDDETAIEYYEQALQLEPNHSLALNNLGHIYHQKQDWELSLGAFRRAGARQSLSFRKSFQFGGPAHGATAMGRSGALAAGGDQFAARSRVGAPSAGIAENA